MKKKHKDNGMTHVYIGAGLLAVLGIVCFDAYGATDNAAQNTAHAAPPTYVVCHGVDNKVLAGHAKPAERYYCSTEGCISDAESTVTVVGTYENALTCSGIADRFTEGL